MVARWRAPQRAAMARPWECLLVGCLLVLGAAAQRSHRGTLEVPPVPVCTERASADCYTGFRKHMRLSKARARCERFLHSLGAVCCALRRNWRRNG